MPSDGKYYDVEEGWTREIDSAQYVSEDTHLMDVLRKLQTQPFLLVDYMSGRSEYLPKDRVLEAGVPEDQIIVEDQISFENFEDDSENVVKVSFSQLEEYFPDIAEKEIREYESTELPGIDRTLYRYGIITLTDINRRPVKDMLYKVISELSSQLSMKIENEYPNSESILQHLRPVTVGHWWKDQMEGLELHIAEHMYLLEMMQVIQSSDKDFVKSCGFSSKKDVENLSSINEVRNKVMHANRSLIYNRKDIQQVLDVINEAQTIISNID